MKVCYKRNCLESTCGTTNKCHNTTVVFLMLVYPKHRWHVGAVFCRHCFSPQKQNDDWNQTCTLFGKMRWDPPGDADAGTDVCIYIYVEWHIDMWKWWSALGTRCSDVAQFFEFIVQSVYCALHFASRSTTWEPSCIIRRPHRSKYRKYIRMHHWSIHEDALT